MHTPPRAARPHAIRATAALPWPAALAALAAGLAGLLWLFRDTAVSQVQVWIGSATFNHCFLVIPISVWLAWRRRAWVAEAAPRPSPWGLAVLAAMGLVWLVGELASFREPQHFALVGMVQGVVLAVLGVAVCRRLAFPLLYLLFLVPTGEFLVPPLQEFTTAFIVAGLTVVGVPVYSDGVFLEIPNGRFEVAEACAGLRFLVASLAFGALFANLAYASRWRRAAFMAASVVVPILANGVRAFGIVMIAHLSDNRLAAGVDHIVYGWGFFAVVTLLLTWIGLRFEQPVPPRPTAPAGRAGSVAGLAAAALAAVMMAGLPRLAAERIAGTAPRGDLTALALPAAERARVPANDSWRPVLPGADREMRASYGDGEAAVQFYLGYFLRQGDGRKIISSQNRIADDRRWNRLGGGAMPASVDGRPMTVLYERITDGTRRRLVWYWYWVDGRFTASPLMAKLLQVKAELAGGVRSAALIAVAADYHDRPAEAAERLAAFLAAAPLAPALALAAAGE